MDAKQIDAQIEALQTRKSRLGRIAELEKYLAADKLEVAVSIPPSIDDFRHRDYDVLTSAYDCDRTHHDALPEAAQDVLRAHMREALEAAIKDLKIKVT